MPLNKVYSSEAHGGSLWEGSVDKQAIEFAHRIIGHVDANRDCSVGCRWPYFAQGNFGRNKYMVVLDERLRYAALIPERSLYPLYMPRQRRTESPVTETPFKMIGERCDVCIATGCVHQRTSNPTVVEIIFLILE